MFELKKYREVMFDDTDPNFEEKLWLVRSKSFSLQIEKEQLHFRK